MGTRNHYRVECQTNLKWRLKYLHQSKTSCEWQMFKIFKSSWWCSFIYFAATMHGSSKTVKADHDIFDSVVYFYYLRRNYWHCQMAAWLGELNPSFGYRFFLQLKNISWLSPNIIHISWNFYHVKDNDIWASRPIFMIIKDKMVWIHHPLAFDIFIWILIGIMGKMWNFKIQRLHFDHKSPREAKSTILSHWVSGLKL